MKQYVTQATIEEVVHWNLYKVSVVKAGDHYNLEMRMNTQTDTYEDAIEFLEWTFECLKLVYHKETPIIEEVPTEEVFWTKPKKRWWPKGKKRTWQIQVHKGWPKGKPRWPRKKKSIVTTDDLKKKSKKLSEFDPFSFIKSFSDWDTLNQNCS